MDVAWDESSLRLAKGLQLAFVGGGVLDAPGEGRTSLPTKQKIKGGKGKAMAGICPYRAVI